MWRAYVKERVKILNNRIFLLLICSTFFLFSSCGNSEKVESNPSLDYRVALPSNWYKLSLGSKEANAIAFTNELMDLFAKREGIKLTLRKVSSDKRLKELLERQYDALVSEISPGSAFSENYIFSKPFLLLGPLLLIHRESEIFSLKEMEGKIIGVRRGASIVFDVDVHASVIFRYYDDISNAIEDLVKRRIDGVVLEGFMPYEFVGNLYKEKLLIVKPPLTDKAMRLIVHKERLSEEFIVSFNQWLEELKKNGEYETLLKKWDIPQ